MQARQLIVSGLCAAHEFEVGGVALLQRRQQVTAKFIKALQQLDLFGELRCERGRNLSLPRDVNGRLGRSHPPGRDGSDVAEPRRCALDANLCIACILQLALAPLVCRRNSIDHRQQTTVLADRLHKPTPQRRDLGAALDSLHVVRELVCLGAQPRKIVLDTLGILLGTRRSRREELDLDRNGGQWVPTFRRKGRTLAGPTTAP